MNEAYFAMSMLADEENRKKLLIIKIKLYISF